MSLHKTRIDIPAKGREKVVKLLGERLLDLLDLKLAVKQAHWNVKGPGFIELHELFDEIAGRVDGHADELAERITSLGGVALGRSQLVAKGTSLAPYPDNIFIGPKHLAALAERVAAAAKSTRAAIDTAADLGDEVTSDLFNEVTGVLDKDLWFIEAHLQA
jgi:starvation-inducible DNA-binding protein